VQPWYVSLVGSTRRRQIEGSCRSDGTAPSCAAILHVIDANVLYAIVIGGYVIDANVIYTIVIGGYVIDANVLDADVINANGEHRL
jgi:hypothetical protein